MIRTILVWPMNASSCLLVNDFLVTTIYNDAYRQSMIAATGLKATNSVWLLAQADSGLRGLKLGMQCLRLHP